MAAAVLASGTPAAAQEIVAPVDGVINVGGPGFGLLVNTFNQAGLSIFYTPGVTNFDAYIAMNPTHTTVFACCEWFSEQGTTSATVTYDMGSVMTLDRLALWNEEVSGIGRLNLLWSVNNVDFFTLALGLTPINNPPNVDYPAEVFAFAPTALRYVRFEMSECPQPNPGAFPACAIGEVAFRTMQQQVVPEPLSMVLLGTGLLALGVVRRRRRP